MALVFQLRLVLYLACLPLLLAVALVHLLLLRLLLLTSLATQLAVALALPMSRLCVKVACACLIGFPPTGTRLLIGLPPME